MNDTTSLKHCCYSHCPTVFRSGSPLSLAPLGHSLTSPCPWPSLGRICTGPWPRHRQVVPVQSPNDRRQRQMRGLGGNPHPMHAYIHMARPLPPSRPDRTCFWYVAWPPSVLFTIPVPARGHSFVSERPRRRCRPPVLVHPTILSVYPISASGHHERFVPPVDLAPGPHGPGCRPILGRPIRSPGSAASLCRMLPLPSSLPTWTLSEDGNSLLTTYG